MTTATFDFAILGDNQPEGLWAGSALVRKGYSVALIPSSALGELPSEDFVPLTFPTQAGSRRLDDLLFRAGFFRLEDSGLISSPYQTQLVLPRNRISLEGGLDQWIAECEREFPFVADLFKNVVLNLKKNNRPEAGIRRAASEIFQIQKKDPAFSRWFELELEVLLKPSPFDRQKDELTTKRLIENWLRFMLQWGGKWYRVDPRLKTSYTHFLQEHARKWGVQLIQSITDIKSHWSSFQITKDQKARYLIANGLGAIRAVSKVMERPLADRFSYWLFVDRIETPLSALPEPLQEFCVIDLESKVSTYQSYHFLHTKRDALRDEATLSLGTWLAFEEPRTWMTEIEKGRSALRKVIPFLPTEAFRQLPSLLDLTEMRGECVRRGQVDRLIAFTKERSNWEKFRFGFKRIVRARKGPEELSNRIFSLTPCYSDSRNRMRSFEEALNLLDFFEKKRRIA